MCNAQESSFNKWKLRKMPYRAALGSINSLPSVQLESETISVSILPDVGAKIYDLILKKSGRNILWHNPRIEPQRFPIEANFDNYWSGGWDEGFPTCDACEHQGESYPNLGELRSVCWKVERVAENGNEAVAELSTFGPISPVRAVKTVTLSGATVAVRYQVTNLGPLPLDFIWGSHPALAVTEATVLHIPAKTGIVGLSSHPSLGRVGEKYDWPYLETTSGRIDISRVQGIEAGTSCGHYATSLRAGWYAVEFSDLDMGLIFRFPLDLCPQLWMWLVYGGWRGYHHVIVEPWTSYPVNLAEAVRHNTHRRLQPEQTFVAEVSATVHDGLTDWQETLRRIESR